MKLTSNQERVLRAIQLQANAPVSKIARETGLKEHTVRYCLHHLKEMEILRPATFINFRALGFQKFKLFFSIASNEQKARSKLIKRLKEHDLVQFAAEVGGDTQYDVTFFLKAGENPSAFLEDMWSSFGGQFIEKSISEVTTTTLYGSKFLEGSGSSSRALSDADPREPAPFDELDHRILAAYNNSSFRSNLDIARELGVPLSSLDYRFKRLEERGIIEGYFYIITPMKFGLISFDLHVAAGVYSESFNKKFHRYCLKHKNVDIVFRGAGSWDYILIGQFRTYEEAMELSQDLYANFLGEIHFIKVIPLLHVHKAREYPFLNYEVFKDLGKAAQG